MDHNNKASVQFIFEAREKLKNKFCFTFMNLLINILYSLVLKRC